MQLNVKIWLLLLASFPVMMAILYALSCAVIKIQKNSLLFAAENKEKSFATVRGAVDYVTNVFFSHGFEQIYKT